ncbi:MAG TPA: hypothetical protein VGQ08_13825 [Nitrospiraceae bacterium]|jgi:hypothetical protein|nr:hypothetical protein [Nitrospiraceae bacterium]
MNKQYGLAHSGTTFFVLALLWGGGPALAQTPSDDLTNLSGNIANTNKVNGSATGNIANTNQVNGSGATGNIANTNR